MKLRTRLIKVRYCFYPEGESGEMFHDAAIAHALWQAACEKSPDALEILNRADELMREWGFGG